MNKEKRIKQLKNYSNSALIRLIIQLEETVVIQLEENSKLLEKGNEKR